MMKLVFTGLAAGAVVAGFMAWRESTKLQAQGATLTTTLQQQSQQVSDTLNAGGDQFRTALTALANAQAQADALARGAQLMKVYGLTPDVLQKLEAYRNAIS